MLRSTHTSVWILAEGFWRFWLIVSGDGCVLYECRWQCLGGVEHHRTDRQMSHLFSAYWCWYPVMFALAAFRRALTLKLACSFPPLHSHALMRVLAFTLHRSSPLSPTRALSSHAVCPSPLLLVVFLFPWFFYHLSTPITNIFTPFNLFNLPCSFTA